MSTPPDDWSDYEVDDLSGADCWDDAAITSIRCIMIAAALALVGHLLTR